VLIVVLPAGWFSLNVPSGLTLYWFVNNIISTAMQLYMRNTIKVEVPALESAGAGAIIDVSSTVIKPKEDRSKQVGSHGPLQQAHVSAGVFSRCRHMCQLSGWRACFHMSCVFMLDTARRPNAAA
jgi:hypothetical protein